MATVRKRVWYHEAPVHSFSFISYGGDRVDRSLWDTETSNPFDNRWRDSYQIEKRAANGWPYPFV